MTNSNQAAVNTPRTIQCKPPREQATNCRGRPGPAPTPVPERDRGPEPSVAVGAQRRMTARALPSTV